LDHEYIGTEHILLGLLMEEAGVAAILLKRLGCDFPRVCVELEKIIKIGRSPVGIHKLPMTPRARNIIKYAIEESRGLNHNYVGTEHLLLGVVRETDAVAARILLNVGVTLATVCPAILAYLAEGRPPNEQSPISL
jgi:ATP-dependent Clp protease ATP-binding subunit ClpC